MPLVAEHEMEYTFYDGFVRHSFRGKEGGAGALGVMSISQCAVRY